MSTEEPGESASLVDQQADEAAARALASAASVTTRGIELAIARLLADRATAASVVDILTEADLLADGVALAAFVAASRRGVEHTEAMAGLAAGMLQPPDAPSDYEVRSAAHEARAAIAQALACLAPTATPWEAGAPVEVLASPAGVVEAAEAGMDAVLLDAEPIEGGAPGAVAEVVASLRLAGAAGLGIGLHPATDAKPARIAAAVLRQLGLGHVHVRGVASVSPPRDRTGTVVGVPRSPRYVDVLTT